MRPLMTRRLRPATRSRFAAVLAAGLLAVTVAATPALAQTSRWTDAGAATVDATETTYPLEMGEVTPKIVNGTVVPAPNPYPWMTFVFIYSAPGANTGGRCGGSLIAANWVLTAAHCVNDVVDATQQILTFTSPLSIASYPFAGSYDSVAAELFVHPDYNDVTKANDVALIRLATPVPGTVTPAKMVRTSDTVPVATPAKIIGWGTTTSGGQVSDDLRQASVAVSGCGAYGTTPTTPAGAYIIPAVMLCATGATAQGALIDTCQGDSGGPLFTTTNNEPRIIGLTSWGRGCAVANYPGVYTRLSAFRAWVDGIAGTGGTPTTCAINNPNQTNNQSAMFGTAVRNAPQLKVTDASGDPVAGVSVTFSITSGNGTVGGNATATVTTDANGVATAPAWVLGPDLGENTLTAAVAQLCSEVFTATATEMPPPAIELTKTVVGTPGTQAGAPVTWSVTATNVGGPALSSVVVSDLLTDELFTCGTLEPEDACTNTVTYALTQDDLDAGVVTNTASVIASPPEGNDVTDDAESTAELAALPGIGLVKGVASTEVDDVDASGSTSVGDVITYTFAVTNTGNVTLNDVAVSDPLPGLSSLACVPALPGVLAPGQVANCSATYALTAADVAAGKVANAATATGVPVRGEPVASSSGGTLYLRGLAMLEVVKVFAGHTDTNNNGAIDAGETLRWTVTATNGGATDLMETSIVDQLTGDVKDCGTLSSQATCELVVAYTVTPSDVAAGRVVNVAVVSAMTAAGERIEASDDDAVVFVAGGAAMAKLPSTGGDIGLLPTGLAVALAGAVLWLLARRRLGLGQGVALLVASSPWSSPPESPNPWHTPPKF